MSNTQIPIRLRDALGVTAMRFHADLVFWSALLVSNALPTSTWAQHYSKNTTNDGVRIVPKDRSIAPTQIVIRPPDESNDHVGFVYVDERYRGGFGSIIDLSPGRHAVTVDYSDRPDAKLRLALAVADARIEVTSASFEAPSCRSVLDPAAARTSAAGWVASLPVDTDADAPWPIVTPVPPPVSADHCSYKMGGIPQYRPIEVRSEPTGAQVFWDGTLVGTTNTTLRVRGGFGRLVIRKPGYVDIAEEIELYRLGTSSARSTSGGTAPPVTIDAILLALPK